MRNRKTFRKLNRTASHRVAMLRNMVTSLVMHERIRTTVPKAKELRRYADRVITYGKKNTQVTRVKALGILRTHEAFEKLISDIAPRYETREGGYTRVLKCGWRRGDKAPMAIIEFVDREGELRQARPPTAAGEEEFKDDSADFRHADE